MINKARNRWIYSSGCIGRDMVYTMVSLFMMSYVQFAVGLTDAQFWALTGIMIACRIWDAVNDPMMSTIVTNTKSKYGKYRPWILIGGLTNAIVFVSMFSLSLEGWAFVIVFGLLYIIWEMTYTINDVSYWSLLPALATEKNERDQLTTQVAVFASVGAFAAGGLIPILTTGDAVKMYRIIAIIIAIIFVICSVMVAVFVRDNSNDEVHEEAVGLKQMVKIIGSNPQILWMAIVILCYSLGSAILNAFGQNFFYFTFEYEGSRMLAFTIVYGVGTLVSQGIYPFVAKRLKRKQITKFSVALLVAGYLLFFIISGIKMNLDVKLIVLCVFGVLIFAGQGLFYLNMLVKLANTIEYDEWKTGQRNESIIFSVRPFMVKLASALQSLVVTATLMFTGLIDLSNKIAEIEKEGQGTIETQLKANEAIQLFSQNGIYDLQILGLRFSMTIIPIILFVICYIILRKKYIIDEEMYEKITGEIAQRKESK